MLEVSTVVSVTSFTLSVQIIHFASKFYGSSSRFIVTSDSCHINPYPANV